VKDSEQFFFKNKDAARDADDEYNEPTDYTKPSMKKKKNCFNHKNCD
jgi:hypothetical protein